MRAFYEFREWYKLDGGVVVKEFCYAINGDSPQIRPRRWQRQRNFLGRRGLECSGVDAAHDLYRTIGNHDVCTEFELLEVKVPIIFLGTMGFLATQEGTLVMLIGNSLWKAIRPCLASVYAWVTVH
jgi:hypothetical protein